MATASMPPRATKQQTAAKSGKTRRATKYPWDQIKDHYITAESLITLKDLAEVYSIPYETLRQKSGDERWGYLRTEHQTKAALAKQEKRRNKMAGEVLAFDDVSLKASKLGQTLVVGRLAQIAELFQAQGINWQNVVEKARQGIPLERHETMSVINYKELVELANALDRYQTVGRRALGTDVENLNIQGGFAVMSGGQGNAPVNVFIGEELQKPDLDRTASVIETMRRSGLESLFAAKLALPEGKGEGSDVSDAQNGSEGDSQDDNIVDAEIVEG